MILDQLYLAKYKGEEFVEEEMKTKDVLVNLGE